MFACGICKTLVYKYSIVRQIWYAQDCLVSSSHHCNCIYAFQRMVKECLVFSKRHVQSSAAGRASGSTTAKEARTSSTAGRASASTTVEEAGASSVAGRASIVS